MSMYIPLVKKWNVLNFDHVIGQPMVVKILKNSLFLDHIFPVYIFAGKHGCGKTSTARLFSTALNCFALSDFRKNVNSSLPCYVCDSCRAMRTMQHPDFIEIDAASHTGVDNVRLIIESALLLPIFGNKKIYLIDEAHMLSKAAWNAFLKILEEPPKNVIFILATTAEEKILETVRSRCFQLFFKAIREQELTNYLIKIATEEKIEHTKEGICALVRASGGSVRDALNLLDQARLSTPLVDVVSLSSMIFHTHEQEIIQVLHAIFSRNIPLLLHNLHEIFASNQVRTEKIIDRLIEYVHAILLFSYDQKRVHFSISSTLLEEFLYVKPALLINLLDELYSQEMIIRRVEKAEILLEVILLRFIESVCDKSILLRQGFRGQAPDATADKSADRLSHNTPLILPDKPPSKQETSIEIFEEKLIKNTHENNNNSLLSQFIKELEVKQDPLLLSIFKQAILKNFDKEKKSLMLSFKKDLLFFESLLYENKADWQPLLEKIWGSGVTLQIDFSIITQTNEHNTKVQKELLSRPMSNWSSGVPTGTPVNVEAAVCPPESLSGRDKKVKTAETATNNLSFEQKKNNNFYNTNRFSKLKPIDVTDEKKWPYANTLQKIFPGVVTEVE